MKIQIVSDDGTIKGAWIATLLTFCMIVIGIVALCIPGFSERLATAQGYWLTFYGISLSVYFAKKGITEYGQVKFGGKNENTIPASFDSNPGDSMSGGSRVDRPSGAQNIKSEIGD